MRNILGHCPRHLRNEIANEVKLIFQAENKNTAIKLARELIETYASKAPAAMDCFESGLEDGLAVLELPTHYRRRLRTSNLAERMNEEIRRRERVIRIFPNEDAEERLIGAILVELYDDWQAAIRYFDMTEFKIWRQERQVEKAQQKVIQIKN